MGRVRKFVELGLLCSFWPIAAGTFVYGAWKTLMWSYGGREVWRFYIIQEPLEREWFNITPKLLLQRDAPLGQVPKRLETYGHEMPEEEGAAGAAGVEGGKKGSGGADHPHQRNY